MILTFIIPVRHQDSVSDWGSLKKKMAETIRSVASQHNENWKAVIVANRGADLPELPDRFDVKWVDFAYSPLPDEGKEGKEAVYEAIRLDKGRRILAGMLHAGSMGHVMVVDYDDLVSNQLASFVAENRTMNGWFLKKGYVWGDGGKLLYVYTDFSRFCGTSHIIRSDLYNLPESFEAASDKYIRRILGSHMFLHDDLNRVGTPLSPLPFIGAVYRIGHSEAASKSEGLISHFFRERWLLKKPGELMRRILCLRLLTHEVRNEFFGERPAAVLQGADVRS
jgi:hypothetical protein